MFISTPNCTLGTGFFVLPAQVILGCSTGWLIQFVQEVERQTGLITTLNFINECIPDERCTCSGHGSRVFRTPPSRVSSVPLTPTTSCNHTRPLCTRCIDFDVTFRMMNIAFALYGPRRRRFARQPKRKHVPVDVPDNNGHARLSDRVMPHK